MATIDRNGEQAEGWKIEITFSRQDLENIQRAGRWTFVLGEDLKMGTHGQEVQELIVTAGADQT